MNDKEIATFGGGCFWCTEAIFKRLKGVISVKPGYSGGDVESPTTDQVHSGSTGHAESIQIEFDPSIIPYVKLVEVFFKTHDPTTLNRQGADVGSQYRSIIFYHNDKQKENAEKYKRELEKAGIFKDPIVTEIVPFKSFYEADEYHKNFYEKNKMSPYCIFVINPKLEKLRELFGKDLKE
ncbi:peptide-methionine (S)-S-oxide reductase MsrA [Candidatus Gottesmanbacteria bacterium]|nr:peptide-methionine (S)-S-oxide reductase MsrA [Candidatus Gottesmanbacteria bacterium]